MIIAVVGIGIGVGWLIGWLSDYLPRFSTSDDIPPEAARLCRPAVAQLAATRPNHWRGLPDRQHWFWLHLAVEGLCATGAAILVHGLGLTWDMVGIASGLAFFLLIAVIDIKYRLVLNILTYPAIVLVLVIHAVIIRGDLLTVLLGGAFAFMIFFLTAWLRPGDIGGGDTKLATFLGLMFGFPGILWVLIVGVGLGGIAAVVLLLTQRFGAKSYMAYAPFLCLGGAVALLYNPIVLM
jgi:prepilin signal peptidase PulO-like enzyme (type II secretory pathway)